MQKNGRSILFSCLLISRSNIRYRVGETSAVNENDGIWVERGYWCEPKWCVLLHQGLSQTIEHFQICVMNIQMPCLHNPLSFSGSCERDAEKENGFLLYFSLVRMFDVIFLASFSLCFLFLYLNGSGQDHKHSIHCWPGWYRWPSKL